MYKKNLLYFCLTVLVGSVADPDPAGSEAFCRIRIRIRSKRPDPDPAENCHKIKEESYKFNQKSFNN